MVRRITQYGAFLVAAVAVTTTAVNGQTPAADPAQVTVVGCVTRNGSVDVDKGTRRLNMDPNGLALTSAKVTASGGGRASAVPGSRPDGTNTGTIPQQTIVGGSTDEPDTLAFALSGTRAESLAELVGRRVEVVGRFLEPSDAAAESPRGTAGTSRDAAPVAGAGTREERAGEGPAHPSAELRKLDVVSFRPATGACQ